MGFILDIKNSSEYEIVEDGQTFKLKKIGLPQSIPVGSSEIDTGCTISIRYQGDVLVPNPPWYNYIIKMDMIATYAGLLFTIPYAKPNGKDTIKINVLNTTSGSLSFTGHLANGYMPCVYPIVPTFVD